MKHPFILLFLTAILSSSCHFSVAQSRAEAYNLDFESVVDGAPVGWKAGGDAGYTCAVDSVSRKSGIHSLCIEYHGDKLAYGAWSLTIPYCVAGGEITLTGYLKTEQVEGGYAGLWMRLDPDMGFDNMGNRGVKGTTDWTPYSITLPLQPDKIKQIVVGGLLVGTGKMWIDQLRIQIDGKDLALLEPLAAKVYPADSDQEFANTSAVTVEMLKRLTNKELTDLGLIWGYLKYYHPALQQGRVNWDAALFRLLPRLCGTVSKREREALFVKWIDDLGDYEQSDAIIDTNQAKLLPDLDWITASKFSKALTDRLIRLKNAKREPQGYYINFADYVSNPIFTNEHNPDALYPDAGYRLLAVYRYWNMIQYFYPNRHLIGEDWIGVLAREIPAAVAAADQKAYDFVMLDLIARIHDTHANIWSNLVPINRWKGENWAMQKIVFVENQAVVSDFYDVSSMQQDPLQRGDILLTVDHKSVAQIIAERWDRTPASNDPTKLRDIAQGLLRSNAEQIAVTYLRNGVEHSGVLKTYPPQKIAFNGAPKSSFREVTDQIAYLYMGTLKRTDCETLFDKIRSTQGLIIDLRCYPSDFSTLYTLGDNLLISKPTCFYKVGVGSGVHPGLFTFRDAHKIGFYNLFPYKGKIVILVNEQTQSAAEFMALALRVAPNAVVVGSTTAGADGDVSLIELPGEIITYISGVGIYDPTGGETQRVGIVPDRVVKPTLDGIKAGRDEVLEQAIAWIEASKK